MEAAVDANWSSDGAEWSNSRLIVESSNTLQLQQIFLMLTTSNAHVLLLTASSLLWDLEQRAGVTETDEWRACNSLLEDGGSGSASNTEERHDEKKKKVGRREKRRTAEKQ